MLLKYRVVKFYFFGINHSAEHSIIQSSIQKTDQLPTGCQALNYGAYKKTLPSKSAEFGRGMWATAEISQRQVMSASRRKAVASDQCAVERDSFQLRGLRMSGIRRSLANTEVLFHQRGEAPHPRSHSWVCHKYMMNRVRLFTNSNYISTTNNLAPALLMGFPP